jgi:hypothetical protein
LGEWVFRWLRPKRFVDRFINETEKFGQVDARRNSRKSAWQTLLPPSVALLQHKDSHERFHRVDFAVIDLERFPPVNWSPPPTCALPSHAQPDDAHALMDGDDVRLHIT